jgi:hypothetical protein
MICGWYQVAPAFQTVAKVSETRHGTREESWCQKKLLVSSRLTVSQKWDPLQYPNQRTNGVAIAYSIPERCNVSYLHFTARAFCEMPTLLLFLLRIDFVILSWLLISMFVFDILQTPSGWSASASLRDWVNPHKMKSHSHITSHKIGITTQPCTKKVKHVNTVLEAKLCVCVRACACGLCAQTTVHYTPSCNEP